MNTCLKVTTLLFLASFCPVHASGLEVNCTDEPGKNLCWQLESISVDVLECTNREFWDKARLSHRLSMFTMDVNKLPMRFNVSNDVKSAANVAKEAIGKLNKDCSLKSGSLGDHMRDNFIRLDFQDGLKLLTN
jgi:hypothetical protein